MPKSNFLDRLFGLVDSSSTVENENRIDKEENKEKENAQATLQDVVSFIAELQSYYYNDICKMQSDLVVKAFTPNQEKFINKKIKQEQVVLSQIDEILKLVKQNEKEYQSIWRKSIYSFYDELEKVKLAEVQAKVFEIIVKLCAINTKPELKPVIFKRMQSYKNAWNIPGELEQPKNYHVVLLEENDGIEKYQFGEFQKSVYTFENDVVLNAKQLEQIQNLTFEFEPKFRINQVWVHVAGVTRAQLNRMRRTCLIENSWEQLEQRKDLYFDVVKFEDLEQYLKGILQIVLTKNAHAVISIVIPTDRMLSLTGETKQNGEKIEICKKYQFYLRERSGIYGEKLLTARISRRYIPEKLKFVSYLKFRKEHF